MEELQLLLTAVRAAMCDRQDEMDAEPEMWQKVCSLAKAHDLSLITFEGLAHVEFPPNVSRVFLRHGAAAVARYYAQNEAVERLTAALEAAAIDYMPLKGAVLRGYYPNPEWRVGRDVDILVRRADFDRARTVAVGAVTPAKVTEGAHDVGMETADGVRIELHFSLFNGNEGFGDLLSDPFANALNDGEHRYRMPDAELYAYHIAHMAKHFRNGGCGIRAFLDLFLLLQNLAPAALEEARLLLTSAGLDGFDAVVCRQSRVFFGDLEGDDDTQRLARFVAENQAFGSFESGTALAVGRSKGKKKRLRRILGRAFPRYRIMCYLYPVLRRWPILLPICWILRGFRIFSKKDRARFTAASRAVATVSDARVSELALLYQYLKLEG